jgi:hypothetical protein
MADVILRKVRLLELDIGSREKKGKKQKKNMKEKKKAELAVSLGQTRGQPSRPRGQPSRLQLTARLL